MGQVCINQCIKSLILIPLWGRYNIIHFSSTHEESELQDAQPVAKGDTVSGPSSRLGGLPTGPVSLATVLCWQGWEF